MGMTRKNIANIELRPVMTHLAMGEWPSLIANSLTSREAEVAHLVSRGLRNKEIARELHLSEGTVKMYLHHLYEKLRLSGRMELAALSTAGACARLPVSGNGARLPEELGNRDSVDATTSIAFSQRKNLT